MTSFSSSGPRFLRQSGAALFVALVFLVLVSLLAISGSGSAVLQERMTGALRDRQLGQVGAETALRGGEADLWSLSSRLQGQNAMPPCVSGITSAATCVYSLQNGTVASAAQAFRTAQAWTSAGDGARAYAGALSGLSGDDASASLAAQPRYLIEDMGLALPSGPGNMNGPRFGASGGGGSGAASPKRWYRITGKSLGGTAAVVRAYESVMATADLTNPGFNPDATPGG